MIEGGSSPRTVSPSSGIRLTLIFMVPFRPSARTSVRPLRAKSTPHRSFDTGRDEIAHPRAKFADLLDLAGADKRVFVLGHQEDRLNTWVQLAIHQRKLKFKL